MSPRTSSTPRPPVAVTRPRTSPAAPIGPIGPIAVPSPHTLAVASAGKLAVPSVGKLSVPSAGTPSVGADTGPTGGTHVSAAAGALLPPFTGSLRRMSPDAPTISTAHATEIDVWGLWPLIDVNASAGTRPAASARSVAEAETVADALAARLELLAERVRTEGVQALATVGADELLVSAFSAVFGRTPGAAVRATTAVGRTAPQAGPNVGSGD